MPGTQQRAEIPSRSGSAAASASRAPGVRRPPTPPRHGRGTCDAQCPSGPMPSMSTSNHGPSCGTVSRSSPGRRPRQPPPRRRTRRPRPASRAPPRGPAAGARGGPPTPARRCGRRRRRARSARRPTRRSTCDQSTRSRSGCAARARVGLAGDAAAGEHDRRLTAGRLRLAQQAEHPLRRLLGHRLVAGEPVHSCVAHRRSSLLGCGLLARSCRACAHPVQPAHGRGVDVVGVEAPQLLGEQLGELPAAQRDRAVRLAGHAERRLAMVVAG